MCVWGGRVGYIANWTSPFREICPSVEEVVCSVISSRKRIPVIVSSKQEEVCPQTLSLRVQTLSLGVPPPHSWRISLQILSLGVQTLSLTVVSTTDVVAIVCSYFRI